MSVTVTIIQNSPELKDLPLSLILNKDQLKFGHYDDGWRLVINELGSSDFIVYDPEHIGRGFNVSNQPGEVEEITFRTMTPTSPGELRSFYECIQRVTEQLDCTLYVNDNEMTPEDFQSTYDDVVTANREALVSMCRQIVDGSRPVTMLVSAVYPLTIGVTEAAEFAEDPDAFGTWMHDRQALYAYYAMPCYFIDNEGYQGRYNLTEGVLTILPRIPSVIDGLIDESTGRPLLCDRFSILLISTELKGGLANIPYDLGLGLLPEEKVSDFDSTHILVQPLTLEEFKHILLILEPPEEQLIMEDSQAGDEGAEEIPDETDNQAETPADGEPEEEEEPEEEAEPEEDGYSDEDELADDEEPADDFQDEEDGEEEEQQDSDDRVFIDYEDEDQGISE